MEPMNRPRGSRGLRPTPNNCVSAPPSFQESLFIDSAPLWDRFGDDFEYFSARCSVLLCNTNDKCLCACAVAEPRLAALKIMYLDVCFAMFVFIARCRDRGFAAHSILSIYYILYHILYMIYTRGLIKRPVLTRRPILTNSCR